MTSSILLVLLLNVIGAFLDIVIACVVIEALGPLVLQLDLCSHLGSAEVCGTEKENRMHVPFIG